MSEVLGLLVLFEDVQARLAAESPGVAVRFGWREAPQQINQGTGRANRVVFEPSGGSYSTPKRLPQNPRSLRTLEESTTVYCWGVDTTELHSDLAQYRAARLLHDSVVRAVELSARSLDSANIPVTYSNFAWIEPDRERKFGAECRFEISVGCAIPDSVFESQDDAQAEMGIFLDETLDATDLIVGDP